MNIFKLCLNNVCGIGESGWVIKHKWEQPLRVIPISSLLNHFISDVRLRLSWLAAFSSSLCLRILSIYFSTHRFRVLPFTASPSGCPLDLPCGRTSRTERFYRIQCGSSLAIWSYAVWNISDFSAFLLPGIVEETCVSFFPRSSTQPSNERLAFIGLIERIRLLFSSNLRLFCRANPRVWMIRFFTQLRAFPRFHYFKVTFYRLPDISKIYDRLTSCKYFRSFVSTAYQRLINLSYQQLSITLLL